MQDAYMQSMNVLRDAQLQILQVKSDVPNRLPITTSHDFYIQLGYLYNCSPEIRECIDLIKLHTRGILCFVSKVCGFLVIL